MVQDARQTEAFRLRQQEEIKRLERRRASLKTERSGWDTHWKDLAENISPQTPRFLVQDRNKGDRRNTRILDTTAVTALRVLTAGLVSGVTNPSRPWFTLRTPYADLNERQSVKTWLFTVEQRMREVFLKSNLYTVLPEVYRDLGLFGTAAFTIEDDREDVIRCSHLPIGSYSLACDARGRVNAIFHEAAWTADQIVREFGLAVCSQAVKTAMERNPDQTFTVVHVVEPNPDADTSKLDAKNLPFRSCWYEDGGDQYLRESGFWEFPAIAPRWRVTGGDSYGTSPGMECLGNVKGLQLMAKRKAQILEKFTNPPVNVPAAMRNTATNLVPGGVNYVDGFQAGQTGVVPVHEIRNPYLADLRADMAAEQEQVRRAFYEDLFLMLGLNGTPGMTATEVAARQEEKMIALGPVYLRLNDEMLDRLVARVYGIMRRGGMIPDPPEEMDQVELVVEYLSIMAQTMKALGLASIERVMTFYGSAGQAFPQVLRKVNADRVVEVYTDLSGAPPDLLFDQETTDALRAQDAQAAQAQQAMDMAAQGAQAAHALGTTPLSDNNALAQLLGRMAPAGGVM